jgi:hypothetical protein
VFGAVFTCINSVPEAFEHFSGKKKAFAGVHHKELNGHCHHL